MFVELINTFFTFVPNKKQMAYLHGIIERSLMKSLPTSVWDRVIENQLQMVKYSEAKKRSYYRH